jgi:hypothetical protein
VCAQVQAPMHPRKHACSYLITHARTHTTQAHNGTIQAGGVGIHPAKQTESAWSGASGCFLARRVWFWCVPGNAAPIQQEPGMCMCICVCDWVCICVYKCLGLSVCMYACVCAWSKSYFHLLSRYWCCCCYCCCSAVGVTLHVECGTLLTSMQTVHFLCCVASRGQFHCCTACSREEPSLGCIASCGQRNCNNAACIDYPCFCTWKLHHTPLLPQLPIIVLVCMTLITVRVVQWQSDGTVCQNTVWRLTP